MLSFVGKNVKMETEQRGCVRPGSLVLMFDSCRYACFGLAAPAGWAGRQTRLGDVTSEDRPFPLARVYFYLCD